MKGPIEITSLSAIEHVVRYRPDRIQRLSLPRHSKNPRVSEIAGLAREAKLPLDHAYVARDQNEPAKAYLNPFEYTAWEDFLVMAREKKKALVLALDHLQDPQNLGALCRTAEGLGVLAVLLPKDRSVVVSPGVYHASVGAIETIPLVVVTNLGEALRKLKEESFWILGAAQDPSAKPPAETPDFDKAVLVLGGEWEGVSPAMLKGCDWVIEIPLSGKVESLNVSAAGAILMYELMEH